MTANNHEVVVKWQGQDNVWWDECCAMVLKVFGLPGKRFTCTTSIYDMKFAFRSEKDADLCRILLSEKL